MSSPVRAALAVFDAAALEALANKGLLRRAAKDVDAGKVIVADESNMAITVVADGERVEITTAGPRAATCSCPASGICRHKLAAVLLLQTTPSADLPPGEGGVTSAGVPAPDALAEMLALTPQLISRWAGKAGIRAALDMLAQAEPVIDHEAGSLRVRLGAAWPQVSILAGQGLDGIVSKAAPSRLGPLHAAAVIAVRRAHGLDADAYAAALVPSSEAAAADADFIGDVLSALEDAVPTALAHAPEVLEERFFVLSVSSRADDLPQLSRRLRRIAGMIRARRERDFTALPEALLSALAVTFAHAHAIKAGPDPMLLARLRGELRQGFVPVGSLSLIGLGARVWETRGGAHGVTGYFYTPEGGRVLTASLARSGAHDASFDAATAYAGELLWAAGSLADMVGTQLTLQGARLSPSARLSMSQETVGMRHTWTPSRTEIAGWSVAYNDWPMLADQLQQRFALSLTRPAAGPTVLALLPAATGAAMFDAVRQRSHLALADASGNSIVVVSPRLPARAARAGQRDPLALLAGCAAIEAIIVEAIPGPGAIELQPISAVVRRQAGDAPATVALDPRLLREAEEYSGGGGLGPTADTPLAGDDGLAAIPHDPLSSLTVEITDALLMLAELGLMRPRDDIHRQFTAFARLGRDAGLATLAAACSAVANARPVEMPGDMLRLYHLADRVASLSRRLPVRRARRSALDGDKWH
jgi:hypothetical protein